MTILVFWSIDIPYLLMKRRFLYLTVAIDWDSRCIVGWELDEYRIVINAGTNDHMPDYCYFQIIGARNEITDPDTHQCLGFIPSVKEIVRPIMVQEKFCICEDADDWFVQLADISQQNSLLFTNARKLHINKKQIENCGLGEPINVKDKAVLMSIDPKKQQYSKKMNAKKGKSDHPLLFMSFLE